MAGCWLSQTELGNWGVCVCVCTPHTHIPSQVWELSFEAQDAQACPSPSDPADIGLSQLPCICRATPDLSPSCHSLQEVWPGGGGMSSHLAAVQNVLALDPQFHGTKAAAMWRTTGAARHTVGGWVTTHQGHSLMFPWEKAQSSWPCIQLPQSWDTSWRSRLSQLLLTGPTAVALGLAKQAELLGPV